MVSLNTLYVIADGSRVQKEHDTVVVTVDGERRVQIPLLRLQGIVCLGQTWITPALMSECAAAGIHVSFFSPTGRFLARVEGIPGGNVLLRREQFRAADDSARTFQIARGMVVGKVSNARQFVLHARRDAEPDRVDRLNKTTSSLAAHLRGLANADSLEQVRGLEGIAARDYFESLSLLIKRNLDAFEFKGRSRQPPLDRINALLSMGYSLLMQDCAGALAGVGLDPAVGFLHEERPGRLSLALDLMEEFRVAVVDRLVVTLINRGQINPEDFRFESAGGCFLSDSGRKTFIAAYQLAKQSDVRHEFLEIQSTWGRTLHLQAQLLARVIRGDLDDYPPIALP